MKVIPLSEAKAKLSQYGQLCHDEPVVITVNGKPSFQLVPLKTTDDLIDQLIEQHPGFRRLLEERLRERSVSVATAARYLANRGQKRAKAPTPRRQTKNSR